MTEPRSQLARTMPKPATTDGELKALGARAWIDHKTLVVRRSTIEDPIILGMVDAVADYLGFRTGG